MPDRPVDEDIARKGHQKGSSAKVTRKEDPKREPGKSIKKKSILLRS